MTLDVCVWYIVSGTRFQDCARCAHLPVYNGLLRLHKPRNVLEVSTPARGGGSHMTRVRTKTGSG